MLQTYLNKEFCRRAYLNFRDASLIILYLVVLKVKKKYINIYLSEA